MQSEKEKPVRMLDIAKAAGVSRPVVSAVLSGSGPGKIRVGKKTADRIRKLAEELHFRPNATAQMLAGKTSRIVGVLVDSYAPGPTLQILSEFERQLASNGYRMLVGQTHDREENFRAYIDDFKFYKTAATVALAHAYPHCGFDLYSYLASATNVLLFGEPDSATQHFPFVEMDWEAAYFDVTELLCSRGCRRIVTTMNNLVPYYYKKHLRGYRRGLEKYGLPFREEFLLKVPPTNPFSDGIASLADQILELKADAFLTSDVVAAQTMQELQRRGIRIPEDISIFGCDNETLCCTNPRLATLDYNAASVAEHLFQLMQQLIQGKDISKKPVVLKPILIKRGSIK